GLTMARTMLIALRVAAVTLVLTGLVYPALVTALGRVAFPAQAGGSLVAGDKGAPLGSELLAQRFEGPAYFHPRPSAAGDAGFDPLASGGSNLGPTSSKLRDRAAAAIAKLTKDNPEAPLPVPAELVTTSASGLDPHLSPRAAAWQNARIAHG